MAPPDELPSDGDIYKKMAKDDPSYRRFAHRFEVIDSRQVEGIQMLPRGDRPATEPRKNTWLRCRESLPDDGTVCGVEPSGHRGRPAPFVSDASG